MMGIGWNPDIGTRFGFSTSLNVGFHWISQRYKSASSATDLYQSITSQDFKEISSISKPSFILAQDVRLDASVYQNISIFTQCAFAYIQAGGRPKINGIKLLGNSSYISLGISYALKAANP